MAIAKERGLWGLENDKPLMRRFPPRPLMGMTPSAYWDPHEEELESRRDEDLDARVMELLRL